MSCRWQCTSFVCCARSNERLARSILGANEEYSWSLHHDIHDQRASKLVSQRGRERERGGGRAGASETEGMSGRKGAGGREREGGSGREGAGGREREGEGGRGS